MIQVSVSDIQRNPAIISRAKESIEVIDKRKNESLGTFIPKRRKTQVGEKSLAGILGKYISEDKKNIPFEEVRNRVQKMRVEELTANRK